MVIKKMNGTTSLEELERIANQIVLENTPAHATSPITEQPIPTEKQGVVQNPVFVQTASEREKEITDAGQNPYIMVRGHKFDSDTIKIGLIAIFMWVLIWYNTGLLKLLSADKLFLIIFVGFIAWTLSNIYTASTTSGSVIFETNTLLTVEQMISILFGTMVLFAVFHRRLRLESNCKDFIGRIILYIIVILTLASLWVNLINTGRVFKAIRRFKQAMYNIALSLFLIICLIILKGGNCETFV